MDMNRHDLLEIIHNNHSRIDAYKWEAMSYNVFLYNLCTVLEEAVAGNFTWDAVEGVIDGDIGDTMIDFFETVYKKDSNEQLSKTKN